MTETNEEVIVTINDVWAAHQCSRSARLFFKERGWDYDKFLKEGISSKILEEDGDARALPAVEKARERRRK